MAHVRALLDHCGGACIDDAVVQSPVLGDDGVTLDPAAWPWPEIELTEADVAVPDEGHDPKRLSSTLAALS